MYKSIMSVFVVLASIVFFNVAAANDVCKKDNGNLYCGEGLVDKVSHFGDVNLNGTTVLNNTYVFGDLDAENAQLNSLKVKGNFVMREGSIHQSMSILGDSNVTGLALAGEADLIGNFTGNNFKAKLNVKMIGESYCKDCSFTAAAKFVGEITMLNTHFDSDVELTTLASKFKHSSLHDLLVKTDSSKNTPQTITLDDNSEVHDITFENQKGNVLLSSNSKITGTVKGGVVKPIS